MQEFNRTYWEDMYQLPVDDLPWEIKEAPDEITTYVAEHATPDGRALDAGCGTGNFSEYLARSGYRVTGVDYSEKALEIARAKNAKHRLPISYIRCDITSLAAAVGETRFDLILDYKVSHHLEGPRINAYIDQCLEVLQPGGQLLLVCYSEKDADAQGAASAVGKFGNEMFYRTRQEVERLYAKFQVVSYREVLLGKKLNHPGHCFVFQKPQPSDRQSAAA